MTLADRIRMKLVRTPLRWFVPFWFAQDDYDDGEQLLLIWKWGRRHWELWRWPTYRDVGVLDRTREQSMSRRNQYRLIRAEARLVGKGPRRADLV